jgi:hypothetical protein
MSHLKQTPERVNHLLSVAYNIYNLQRRRRRSDIRRERACVHYEMQSKYGCAQCCAVAMGQRHRRSLRHEKINTYFPNDKSIRDYCAHGSFSRFHALHTHTHTHTHARTIFPPVLPDEPQHLLRLCRRA